MAKKYDAKAFSQQKRKRRQWLTFVRMCRYGVNNFSRNAWLTIAATAVMTVTLLIVFMTLTARQVLVDTVAQIREKVDVSIYVKTETTPEQAKEVQEKLEKLDSVVRVNYTSPEQAKTEFSDAEKGDEGTISALSEATNKLPGTFSISLKDLNDSTELQKFVKEDELYKQIQGQQPTFNNGIIQTIGKWVGFAEKIGIGASVLFIAISSLIIFNTIRMAIFNRKEEIQMMKLIGADRSFIRGPFIVEAVMYGFIAALLATALGVAIMYTAREPLLSYGIAVQTTIDAMMTYLGFVLLGMIVTGAIIGITSSLMATRKYLKL
ncbi:ABC transporter permease [bacterium]|nr:MAG: ABC transporter permease [bacterium]